MASEQINKVAHACHIISKWDLPDPPRRDKYYLSSCYENLIGAGYGLAMAERHHFVKRTSKGYNTVRLASELAKFCSSEPTSAKKPSIQSQDWNRWLSGVYLGSGLHRIVWTSERLLAILYHFSAPAKVRTRSKEGTPHITELVRYGGKWLSQYKSSSGKDLSGLKDALASYKKLGEKADKIGMEDKTLLTVLHNTVNIQKHAFKGYVLSSERLHYSEKFSTSKIARGLNSGPKPWRDLQSDEKMAWTIKALRIVSEMYKNIHAELAKTIEAQVETKDVRAP